MERYTKSFGLHSNYDVVMARQHAREMSRDMGFGLTDQTRIATAVSEVARRAVESHGQISFAAVTDGSRCGIECVCHGGEWETPSGPPAPQVQGGIRGVERLMDDFELLPVEGNMATVVMRKWLR